MTRPIPTWTCPACDYEAVLSDVPRRQTLLSPCTELRSGKADFRRALSDALAKQDEAFSEQRGRLIALAGTEVRRVLEEQHTTHMEWFWTTAGDEMTEALLHRDVVGFMHSGVDSANGLGLVCDTWPLLQGLGMYEACLLDGFTGQKHNFHHWEEETLHQLVELADRDLLRHAGPLPATVPPRALSLPVTHIYSFRREPVA
jgi:hypothetical protein